MSDLSTTRRSILCTLDPWGLCLRYWRKRVAVGVTIGAVTVFILSWFAGSLVLQLKLTVTVVEDKTELSVSQYAGYGPEPNHCLFYLTLTPVFIVLLGRLLESVRTAFSSLYRMGQIGLFGRLPEASGRSQLLWKDARVGLSAPKLMHAPLYLFVALLILGWNVQRELRSRDEAPGNLPKSFGYIQVTKYRETVVAINEALAASTIPARTNAMSQLQRLRLWADLEDRIRTHLLDRPTLKVKWASALLDSSGLTLGKEDVEKSSTFSVHIDKAVNLGLIGIKVQSWPESRTPTEDTFWWLFFAGVMILESSFQALAVWAALTIVWWITVVGIHMPSRRRCLKSRLCILPMLEDDSYHYGLGVLYPAYDMVVWLVALCGFVLLLQANNNRWKGTMDPATYVYGPPLTAVLLSLIVVTAAGAIIVGPIWLFGRVLSRIKEGEVIRLQRQVQMVEQPEGKAALLKRIDTVGRQTTWPFRDKGFPKAIVGFIILFIHPFLQHRWMTDILHACGYDWVGAINAVDGFAGLARWLFSW